MNINIYLEIGTPDCVSNTIRLPANFFWFLCLIWLNSHAWLKSIHILLFESYNCKDIDIKTRNGKYFLIYVTIIEILIGEE